MKHITYSVFFWYFHLPYSSFCIALFFPVDIQMQKKIWPSSSFIMWSNFSDFIIMFTTCINKRGYSNNLPSPLKPLMKETCITFSKWIGVRRTTEASSHHALGGSCISVAGLSREGCCCKHSRTSIHRTEHRDKWYNMAFSGNIPESFRPFATLGNNKSYLDCLSCVDLLQIGFTLCSCCPWHWPVGNMKIHDFKSQ